MNLLLELSVYFRYQLCPYLHLQPPKCRYIMVNALYIHIFNPAYQFPWHMVFWGISSYQKKLHPSSAIQSTRIYRPRILVPPYITPTPPARNHPPGSTEALGFWIKVMITLVWRFTQQDWKKTQRHEQQTNKRRSFTQSKSYIRILLKTNMQHEKKGKNLEGTNV